MPSRSFPAIAVSAFLRVTNPRVSAKRLLKRLEKYRRINSLPYKIPKIRSHGVDISEEYVEGIQVIVFTPSDVQRPPLFYLCGGGYVRMPRRSHIKFLIRLSRALKCPIYSPIYLKAPNHSAEETYASTKAVYFSLTERYGKLSILGDSSGGGLALGVSLDLIKSKYPVSKLVLLSPFVDLTLNDPEIPEYEKLDPLIWRENARLTGRSWAKDVPTDSPLVSPINRDLSGLCRVCLIAGKREMLYPDAKRLDVKLTQYAVEHKFIAADGMNHVYPIYPIPEAKEALREIVDFIKEE